MMFHGSDEQLTAFTGPVCLTSDEHAARAYALRHDGTPSDSGWLHHCAIPATAEIADEDTLLAAASTLGLRPTEDCAAGDYSYVYELADDPRVQQHLAQAGYAGVTYTDQDITGHPHETTVIWDGTQVTITDTELIHE